MNWRIHSFASLPSTQEWIRSRAIELPEGTVAVAETQTAGYGRLGRTWFSPPGGLYVSLLLKPLQLLPDLPFLLIWATLTALEKYTPGQLDMKHPNDIYSQQRKLAGVLADARVEDNLPRYYVCGIGINLNQERFPEDVPAISLRQITARGVDATEVLQALLKQIQVGYTLIQAAPGAFHARFVADLGERSVFDPATEQPMNAKEWLYGYQY